MSFSHPDRRHSRPSKRSPQVRSQLAATAPSDSASEGPTMVYPGENINDLNGGPYMVVPPSTTQLKGKMAAAASAPTSAPSPAAGKASTAGSASSASMATPLVTASLASTLPPYLQSTQEFTQSASPTASPVANPSPISAAHYNTTTSIVVGLVVTTVLASIIGVGAYRVHRRLKKSQSGKPSKLPGCQTAAQISAPVLPVAHEINRAPKSWQGLQANNDVPRHPNSTLGSRGATVATSVRQGEMKSKSLDSVLSYPMTARTGSIYSISADYKEPWSAQVPLGLYREQVPPLRTVSSGQGRRLQKIPFKMPTPTKVDPRVT